MAVDGGAILVGVAEVNGRCEPTPVELAGLPERVEQVALSIPDPPIAVTCSAIPTLDDPTHGYLLIDVPASGQAPHMVDGVYRGRGDKTKVRLSDADVGRLHRQREQSSDSFERLLHEYVERDPVPPKERHRAHGFVVAVPTHPRPEMLLNARGSHDWTPTLGTVLQDGMHTPGTVLEQAGGYTPNLRDLHELARRAEGAAFDTGLDPARRPFPSYDESPHSSGILEFELTEEGAVRVMTTRLSDTVDARGPQVFIDVLPDLTRRVVGAAAAVSNLTGYAGQWYLGVAACGLAEARVFGGLVNAHLAVFGADQDTYDKTTFASTAELRTYPGAVTHRLVGRFLRTVGWEQAPHLQPLVTDR